MAIKLISVNEGDVSDGLVGGIFALVAEWESDVNSKRTKDALEQKFREGLHIGPSPLGYRSVGGEKEKKVCVPDENTAPIIKELFALFATGNYSIIEIQEWLAEKNIVSKNGTNLGHTVIHRILTNPFYYGIIRYNAQVADGKHIPLITKEQYDTCQFVLAKHRNFATRRRKYDFLLRSFVECGDCSQKYTAEWHDDKEKFSHRGGRIGYYHCPKREKNGCPSRYIEISQLEEQVTNQFKEIQFSEEFISLVAQKAKEKVAENRNDANTKRQGILNIRTSQEIKRSSLEDKLLDGTVDRDTYKRKHQEISTRIKSLDKQLSDLENSCRLDMNFIEEVLAFTRNICTTYMSAPEFLKKHYIRFFFEKFIVKDKLITGVVPTPIFKALMETHSVIISSRTAPNNDAVVLFHCIYYRLPVMLIKQR